MPGLLIKDLPRELHGLLKERAARNRRSLAREALVILEATLDQGAGPPAVDRLRELRVRGPRPLTDEILRGALSDGRP